jgi:hypothetical protein
MSKEAVNHPQHYWGENNQYEAIKVIEAWELDFCLGNTVKYISRAGKKDNIVQDLKKAIDFELPKVLKEYCELTNIKLIPDRINPTSSYIIQYNEILRHGKNQSLIMSLLKTRIIEYIIENQ